MYMPDCIKYFTVLQLYPMIRHLVFQVLTSASASRVGHAQVFTLNHYFGAYGYGAGHLHVTTAAVIHTKPGLRFSDTNLVTGTGVVGVVELTNSRGVGAARPV